MKWTLFWVFVVLIRRHKEIRRIIASSIQPASSSRPQPQEYQGQHLSRGRGISRNALWRWLSGLCFAFYRLLIQSHFLQKCCESWIGTEAVKSWVHFEMNKEKIRLLDSLI